MDLRNKIQTDLMGAVKNKKELESLVLRQISATIVNKEKEKRYALGKENSNLKDEELDKESKLTEEEIMSVILSEVKKRKESILEFEKGKRDDLVQKEKKELEILEKYLPEQISDEDLRKLAKEVVEKLGAKEKKDMGKVMAELMSQIKGRADGGRISKTVGEFLS